eukprot:CAMPEP_0119209892 /NCGR_PEP_ID=MMETSP1327-20130426/1825_1 /TAXON_ID=38833 /ORGANISM="Micromonas pusilla, Strain RCC2306" /LENGTH=194 /DNA_ID=CAMNT_0007206821 /DNA_START=29 /DNA_END=614 /DNA_ORIENTATION=+
MVRPHDASHRPPCASFPKSVDSSRRVCVARSTVPGKHGTVPLKKRPRDLGVLPRTFDPRLGPFPCRAHRNVSTPIGFLAHRNAKDESKGHHTAAISVFGDDADPTASPTKQLINPLFTLLNSSGRFQARDERQQQQIQQEHPQAGLVDIHAKQNAKDGFAVGPVMLGFFIFVVVGSSLLQIIKTATSGGPAAGA